MKTSDKPDTETEKRMCGPATTEVTKPEYNNMRWESGMYMPQGLYTAIPKDDYDKMLAEGARKDAEIRELKAEVERFRREDDECFERSSLCNYEHKTSILSQLDEADAEIAALKERCEAAEKMFSDLLDETFDDSDVGYNLVQLTEDWQERIQRWRGPQGRKKQVNKREAQG